MTEYDAKTYIGALSTLLLAVEFQYSKRNILEVCNKLIKTDSSITNRLIRGIKKSNTPKALIRKLNRQMIDEYAKHNFDWTEI